MLTHQVHANLASLANLPTPGGALQIRQGYLEMVRHRFHHRRGGGCHFLPGGVEHRAEVLDGHRQARNRGVGDRPNQGPLQLSNIRGVAGGDVLNRLAGQLHLLVLRLLLQNRNAGLKVRSLNIGNQPHGESGNQALLQTDDLVGGAIGG